MLQGKYYASADLAKELYWPVKDTGDDDGLNGVDGEDGEEDDKRYKREAWPDFIPTEIAL